MTQRRVTPEELEALETVQVHCQMLLYGASGLGSFLAMTSEIPSLYNAFALMHLTVTMFLVDGENDHRGGACYRLLKPYDLEKWLVPIDRLMQRKVGRTTLGRYLRVSRNKLATHGDLSFASLPEEMRLIPSSARALLQFQRATDQLTVEVRRLKARVRERIDRSLSRPADHRAQRSNPAIQQTAPGAAADAGRWADEPIE